MSLIAIIISLLAERYLGTLQDLRTFRWLESFAAWVRRHVHDSLLCFVLVPGAVVIGLLILLGLLPGWFDFLLGIAILIFSLGPRNIEAQAKGFLDALDRNDQESAVWHATQMSQGQALPEEADKLCRFVTHTVLIENNDRVLAVLFWFMLLGPVGALLYRVASQLHQSNPQDDSEFAILARQFHQFLGWIPARLTALAYGLSGSLNGTLHNWRHYDAEWSPQWRNRNSGILASTGWGALQLAESNTPEGCREEVSQALSLTTRATVIWVSIIAVMTIAGLGG